MVWAVYLSLKAFECWPRVLGYVYKLYFCVFNYTVEENVTNTKYKHDLKYLPLRSFY